MQQAKGPEAAKAPAGAAEAKLREEQVEKLMEMAEDAEQKKSVWSDVDIELYGYVKADASYDTSRSTPGNYVTYVDSEATNSNDNEFNLTANQTQLGMKINGSKDNGINTSGRLEIDFYGSGGAENKAKVQMRHAYMKFDWPEDNFSILAGQSSDVISPLNPYTLNYTVLWDVGNIGYRRPQIRATKSFIFNGTSFKLEGAIARNIGRDDLTGSESGEDSGLPSFQGRTSLTFSWLGQEPTVVGFSGHWGKEEYDLSSSGSGTEFDSWSLNFDVTQPVNKWLTIQGEVFTGENLNTYFGGIGQGVNTTKLKEINSMGGWLGASLGPWEGWRFNIGAGMDDVILAP